MPNPTGHKDTVLIEMMEEDFSQLADGDKLVIQNLANQLIDSDIFDGMRGMGMPNAKVILWMIGVLLNEEHKG